MQQKVRRKTTHEFMCMRITTAQTTPEEDRMPSLQDRRVKLALRVLNLGISVSLVL